MMLNEAEDGGGGGLGVPDLTGVAMGDDFWVTMHAHEDDDHDHLHGGPPPSSSSWHVGSAGGSGSGSSSPVVVAADSGLAPLLHGLLSSHDHHHDSALGFHDSSSNEPPLPPSRGLRASSSSLSSAATSSSSPSPLGSPSRPSSSWTMAEAAAASLMISLSPRNNGSSRFLADDKAAQPMGSIGGGSKGKSKAVGKPKPPATSSSSTARRRKGSSSLDSSSSSISGSGGGGKRSARQKADSYERKKTRAKLCRRVMKERFDRLLEALGDPSLRRSDKCGLITGAIDTITALRLQQHQLPLHQHQGGATSSSSALRQRLLLGAFPPSPLPLLLKLSASSSASALALPRRSPRQQQMQQNKLIKSEDAHDKASATGLLHHDHQQQHSTTTEDEEDDEQQLTTSQAGSKRRAGLASEQQQPGLESLWSAPSSLPLPLVVSTFLDPASLERVRALDRRWYEVASRDCHWRDLCAKRWVCDADEQQLGLEQLWALAGLASPLQPTASWREVYVRHHRALTPPPLTSGPRSSAWSSPSWLSQQQVVLGRGYSRRAGVAAWLLPVSYPGQTVHSLPASCVPSLRASGCEGGAGSVAVLLPLRLMLQNSGAHGDVLLPYQPWGLRVIQRSARKADADPFFREVEAWQLEAAGLDPSLFCSKVVAWNGRSLLTDTPTGGRLDQRVPWAAYREAGEMRLGAFESVVVSLWVVAPGCLSWADLAVRASSLTVDLLISTGSTTTAPSTAATAAAGQDGSGASLLMPLPVAAVRAMSPRANKSTTTASSQVGTGGGSSSKRTEQDEDSSSDFEEEEEGDTMAVSSDEDEDDEEEGGRAGRYRGGAAPQEQQEEEEGGEEEVMTRLGPMRRAKAVIVLGKHHLLPALSSSN